MLANVRLRQFSTVAGLVLLTAMGATAQILTGTVVGTVQDAQGGVIPGATVTLISDTRATRSAPVQTNASGDFVVPNVTAGTYTVEVTMPSFKTLQRSGVQVSAGARATVGTLVIDVGAASETVEVKAVAAPVQSTSGERSFATDSSQIENLPLNGRSYAALTAFTPGVSGATNGGQPTRLGGGGANNTMMDGVSTMDTGNNAPLLPLNVEAIAEVKVLTSNYQAEYGRASGLQITAVTKSGSNQFRGSTYAIRRDSNWDSTSWLNKANGQPKPVSKQTDWGYTLGGPIGKPGGRNKLFFFFSQEWRPRTAGGAVTQFKFPTAAERTGDFSQSRDNNGALYPYIKDPLLTGECSAASQVACFQDAGVVGRVPTNRLYPIGLNVLNSYPLPNCPASCNNYNSAASYNYELTRPTENFLNTQPAVRLDYQPTTKLRFTVKYAGEIQRRQTFAGTLPGFNDTRMHDPVVRTIAIPFNYALNATTFVEFNYGNARNAVAGCVNIFSNCNTSIPMSPASDKRNIGLGDLPLLFPDATAMDSRYYEYEQLTKINTPMFQDGIIWLPPTFTWGNRVTTAGGTTLAPPNNPYPGFLNYNQTQDVSVSITKVAGRHTIKSGFYNNHSRKAQNRGGGGPGAINFGNSTSNPLDTTFGFSNAAVGVFSTYTQLSRFMEGSYVSNNTEAYVQDNWRVNSKLTIDAGVRFVRQQPQYDALGQSSNFLPDRYVSTDAPAIYAAGCVGNANPCSGNNRQARNPVTGALLGAGSSLLIGALVPNTGNSTNGIFLGGQGIVKTTYKWPLIAPAPRFGFAYDVTGRQAFVIRGGAGLFFDRPNGNSIYGLVANPPNAYSVTANNGSLPTLGTSGFRVQGAPALTTYEYEANLPSSTQWNAGVQMVLPWSSALDIEYVGQHGFYLGENLDINQVDIGSAFLAKNQDPTLTASATPGSAAVANDLMRGYRGYGSITQFTGRGVNQYHAIQTSFNRRFRSGWSGQLNYTLGLSQTNNSPARLEHDANGNVSYRSDQAAADELLKQGNLLRHVVKANFVWDLPDIKSTGSVLRAVAVVTNDWQLSGVFTGQSGDRYSVGYNFQTGSNTNVTGTATYAGRLTINGDPGSGCTANQYNQFNTAAFVAPIAGQSVGLESGQNYMIGCPLRIWDFSLARNIRVGGHRNVQLRLDAFNAFNNVVFTNRNATVNLQSPIDSRVTNPQFNADGSLVSSRLTPSQAGFGAVTAAAPLRTMQAQIRFGF